MFCFVFFFLQEKIQYNYTFTYQKKGEAQNRFFSFFPEESSKLIRKRNTHNTTEGMWWSICTPYLRKVTRYFLKENKCYQVPAIVKQSKFTRKLTFIQANSRVLLSTVLQQCLTLLIISYKEYWNIHIPKH